MWQLRHNTDGRSSQKPHCSLLSQPVLYINTVLTNPKKGAGCPSLHPHVSSIRCANEFGIVTLIPGRPSARAAPPTRAQVFARRISRGLAWGFRPTMRPQIRAAAFASHSLHCAEPARGLCVSDHQRCDEHANHRKRDGQFDCGAYQQTEPGGSADLARTECIFVGDEFADRCAYKRHE